MINTQKLQISFKQCNIIWSQLSGTYLHNGQWITCIYSFLYEHINAWVSFLMKLQAYSLKKTFAQMVSFQFCVIFEYTFFVKHVWVVTDYAKYFFLCCYSFNASNCLKTDAITDAFHWMYLFEYFNKTSDQSTFNRPSFFDS